MATTIDTPACSRLARRDFLTQAGTGLLLSFLIPSVSRLANASTQTQVNSWLQIGSDGTITLTVGSSEMGQGSFSGLAQVLAEELAVDYSKINTVQGGPSLSAVQPVGAALNTVGSSIVRTNFWKLRNAGAIAREMLVSAAMNLNNDLNRSNYTVQNAVITHVPSGTSYSYASVASAAALLTPPASAPLTPDNKFRLIGTTVPRVDIPAKVDGSAQYGIDIRLPNMLYAVIKHSPALGGTLASTPSVPHGMSAVVPTKVIAAVSRGLEAVGNVNAVAVVGSNTWDAWQAANGLRVTWNAPANAANLSSATFVAQAQALATSAAPYVAGGTNGPGTLYTVEGDAISAQAAVRSSAKFVDVSYTLPYVSHACMEVLNCTVDYKAGVSCDIYAPTQSAKAALSVAVTLTGMTESQIHLHTTYLGGGLGRKAEADFISQAIQVGMAVGKPVKLMWPREEDFTHDQYRPMGLVHATAGLDSNHNITGWTYRNISPSILAQRGAPLGATGDSQGYEGSEALPYQIGSRVTEYVTHPSPIPVGFWRSVGASINTFAVESLIDELAFAAGIDPYQFRLQRLTNPRWVAVLEAAAAMGNWSSAPPKGHYRGIAIGTAFNSIVAEVVEISNVTATGIKVNTVSVALDCYLAVNPGSIQAQLVGGVVHGMNAALYGKQTFAAGVAQSRNFSHSKMIKLGEMPQVNVTILANPSVSDPTVAIGGVGELGVPTFAPALANAYFKATGNRVRTLPFFPNATMSD